MRGTLHFLRKPLKPIIYALVFCVLTLVAFVFALQYELDKIAIEENVNNYSYICTLSDTQVKNPVLSPLPSELVQSIVESEYVKEAEQRSVVSGRCEGTNSMLEYFMTDDTIDMYGMLEGRIIAAQYFEESNREDAIFVVQKNWAGVLTGQSMVNVSIWYDEGYNPNPGEGMLHEDDRVLLIGRFEFDREHNGMKFSSLQIRNPEIKSPKNVLDDNPILFLDWNDDRDETDEYIKEKLTERGVWEYVDKINACRNTFTIHPIWDTSLLLSLAQNRIYICFGRGLTPADSGKKVCIINQVIFSKNHLALGDKINIALSDTNYSCTCAKHDGEWLSGYPTFGAEFPEYGESEEYEIVGVFNFYRQRNVEDDFLSFSRDDIFIPADNPGFASYEGIVPRDFSFRLLGPDYEEFMDKFEIPLFDSGYSLTIEDGGWEDFKENYETISSRKIVSIVSACLFLVAALVLFTTLVLKHFKFEFGLRRLIGASTYEASKIYVTGYLTLGIPALLVALAATVAIYEKWLVIKMAEVIEESLPDLLGCIVLMGRWAGITFAAGFVLVVIISLINGKKNLLSMIK